MAKDIAGLRAGEVKKEREKISKIQAEVETKKEWEIIEEIRRGAQEFKKIEETERKKLEEIEKRRKEEEKKKQEELKKTEEEKERGRKKEEEKIEAERRKIAEKEEKAKKKRELPPAMAISQPPSLLEKVIIRIIWLLIFLIFIFFLITFGYYYLVVRKKEGVSFPSFVPRAVQMVKNRISLLKPSLPQIPPEKPAELPRTIIPPSLISVDFTTTISFSSPEDIADLLSQALNKDLGRDKFVRVVLENQKESRVLDLKEFFDAFSIRTPEGFYRVLDNDFTLYIYSSPEEKNHLGLIVKIQEPVLDNRVNLAQTMRKWESTMEADFDAFLLALGKEKPPIRPFFEEKDYEGVVFRYITLIPAPDYFGICYGTFSNYFILNTSCGDTLKLIDVLSQPR